MISVFIVATSPLSRASLENLLTERQLEVAGSFARLDDLAGSLDDTPVDVILIDTTGEPFEALLDSVMASGLASDFTVILMVEPASLLASSAALGAGVRAVLPNDISPDQLVAALEAARSGLVVLHPTQLSSQLNVHGFAGPPARSRALKELREALTPRESEVLQMLASGLGNKEIAAKLAISEHTAKFHVASILGKLGASSRTEAVSLGIRRGLVLF